MNTLEKILLLKEQRELSDLKFEKELNLSARVVASWKRGISESYMKIIPQIADYFGVSTDYLLCKTDNPTPASSPSQPPKPPSGKVVHNINHYGKEQRSVVFDEDESAIIEATINAVLAARKKRKK